VLRHATLRQCPARLNPARIRVLRKFLAILALAVVGGCAARPQVAKENKAPPATRPTDISLLPLDQIEPLPRISELNPTTQPTTRPSLAALQLYAEGRARFEDRKAAKAVESLRRALVVGKK
jgi:hypothetical protein